MFKILIEKLQTKIFNNLKYISLEKAARAQDLSTLRAQLEQLVPDIENQYSSFKINDKYLNTKVRNLHAFQISLLNAVMENFGQATIIDIGDSAGTHLQYINKLYSKSKKLRCLSVNLDQKAVDRIKNKNLEAIKARAEELDKYNIQPDIILCLEMLEHMMDPCNFLHQLSLKTNAKFLIVTVPYLSQSRTGLHQLRRNEEKEICAENTHIFELCPNDWKLLMKLAGWSVIKESSYLQYPPNELLSITKNLWRKYDFEGFYGVILKKDDTWSSKYKDWQTK